MRNLFVRRELWGDAVVLFRQRPIPIGNVRHPQHGIKKQTGRKIFQEKVLRPEGWLKRVRRRESVLEEDRRENST